LPAAVPGAARLVGLWAEEAERLGFGSVSVLDRLVYDNLDPLVALGAAAARTERVELMTTVLNVGYRRNAVVLGKQLASVDRLSGGRLTAGLALGGWPEDYAASDVPLTRRGALFDDTLATLRKVWAGELVGAAGPMPGLPKGRPGLLLGGLVPGSFTRIAAVADGWVAPFMGFEMLSKGIAMARRAWADANRAGSPRIVVERYFCFGAGAEGIAGHYLEHYYGSEYAGAAKADTVTTVDGLADELGRLAAAGCDDLLLFPCSGEIEQLNLLARALDTLDVALSPSGHEGLLPVAQ
jgi:alkanesulfonate monooxygenase SsuD/methylene tetrahydromethanopterin reductase-like flavin-dependent oxidoreductase (luciferase family)